MTMPIQVRKQQLTRAANLVREARANLTAALGLLELYDSPQALPVRAKAESLGRIATAVEES